MSGPPPDYDLKNVYLTSRYIHNYNLLESCFLLISMFILSMGVMFEQSDQGKELGISIGTPAFMAATVICMSVIIGSMVMFGMMLYGDLRRSVRWFLLVKSIRTKMRDRNRPSRSSNNRLAVGGRPALAHPQSRQGHSSSGASSSGASVSGETTWLDDTGREAEMKRVARSPGVSSSADLEGVEMARMGASKDTRRTAYTAVAQDTWKEFIDPNSLKLYFVNQVTGESRWTLPKGSGVRSHY